MISLWLMGMLTAIAWAHARLTVVAMIHQTTTPNAMLNRMCTNTVWLVIGVTVCYFLLGSWGSWIVMYAIARSMFLLLTNWTAVCDNYYDIKRLLAGN